jgi:hypothetical protein
MGKNQIKYLKLLGYKDTKEAGAILEHPDLYKRGVNLDGYVWDDEKFEDVLSRYPSSMNTAIRDEICKDIKA